MSDRGKRQWKGLRMARDDERKQPSSGEAFAEVGRQFGDAMANLAFVTASQGAIGWMVQGNPDRAVEALQNLTNEQAAKIADAAERLAALIREDRA